MGSSVTTVPFAERRADAPFHWPQIRKCRLCYGECFCYAWTVPYDLLAGGDQKSYPVNLELYLSAQSEMVRSFCLSDMVVFAIDSSQLSTFEKQSVLELKWCTRCSLSHKCMWMRPYLNVFLCLFLSQQIRFTVLCIFFYSSSKLKWLEVFKTSLTQGFYDQTPKKQCCSQYKRCLYEGEWTSITVSIQKHQGNQWL